MKKVECSLLQREPAVVSLYKGDDGGEGRREERGERQN